MARRPLLTGLVSALVVVAGLLHVGSGFVDGDAAVYAAQAWDGDLAQRWVHLGYLAAAALVAPVVGAGLPTALDVGSVLAAGAIVAIVGRRAGLVGALVAAAVVLPVAPFGEVDLPWASLVVAALLPRSSWAVAAIVALAVTVSPVALLALPWLALERRDVLGPAVGGASAVVALTVVSGGDWWIGDRGVLTGAVLLPGRALEAWLVALPWLALPVAWRGWPGRGQGDGASCASGAQPGRPTRVARDAASDGRPTGGDRVPVGPMLGGRLGPLLATSPLLLAPPDVPTWLVPGVALALSARTTPGPAAGVLLAIQLLLAGAALERSAGRVRSEARLIARVAAELDDSTGLVAPWTWGARIGVVATGDPYGPVWRSAHQAVRDQGARWCSGELRRVLVVADGVALWEDPSAWEDRFGCRRDTSAP